MELWLRNRVAQNLDFDEKHEIRSQKEWHEFIYDPRLISSILWPLPPLFQIEGRHFTRNHPHERNYANDSARNISYREACQRLAGRIESEWSSASCLVYAPLRGAYPIWKGIRQFITKTSLTPHFPVTSSFVSFPAEFNIRGRKNRMASGRHNNLFELQRISPFLEQFDAMIYLDEIVSGGMMVGHLKDIFQLGIHKQIRVTAAGIADAYGNRSSPNRRKIEALVANGKISRFYWEGCSSLITEDQKFLLGIHYVDYKLGPHVVPVLDQRLAHYPEKEEFEREFLMERR